jgi:hypothetical protein
MNDLRGAFRFHLEHGGYCTPPGHAACALEAARAELRLAELVDDERANVEWVDDDQPYDPGDVCTDDGARAKFESNEWTGPFGCVVTIDGEQESLWGIVVGPRGTDDPYCRVVEAELASEALRRIDEEAAERARAARHDVATVAQ